MILHMWTIDGKHVMYRSWEMEHDIHYFLSFRVIFYPFTQVTIQIIKILKKWKNIPGDINLHRCNVYENHMMHPLPKKLYKWWWSIRLEHAIIFWALDWLNIHGYLLFFAKVLGSRLLFLVLHLWGGTWAW